MGGAGSAGAGADGSGDGTDHTPPGPGAAAGAGVSTRLALDVALCLDTTADMCATVCEAQGGMSRLAAMLKSDPMFNAYDLRFGLVAYDDHSMSDAPDFKMCTKSFPFCDIERFRTEVISSIHPMGGEDYPECVCCGLVATNQLNWRTKSIRCAVLVGSAPPHGEGSDRGPDTFPAGCPLGHRWSKATRMLEEKGVTRFAVAVDGLDAAGRRTWEEFTGGVPGRVMNFSRRGACMVLDLLLPAITETVLAHRIKAANTAEARARIVAKAKDERFFVAKDDGSTTTVESKKGLPGHILKLIEERDREAAPDSDSAPAPRAPAAAPAPAAPAGADAAAAREPGATDATANARSSSDPSVAASSS